MREGLRVVVATETATEAREAFTAAAAHVAEGERVRRANGAEQITAANGPGWVKFARRGGLRGITADVLVVVGFLPDPAERAVIAASPIGHVIACVAAD